MRKWINPILIFILLIIITVPAYYILSSPGYYAMHDNQHVMRLYLLDMGIKQGSVYPRWVDTLSYGFGDPLFNFYPPLIYFIGLCIHYIGFSYIDSIKLVVVLGYIISAIGMYLLGTKLLNRMGGFLSATLHTYFFYHSVTAYVRGALSEFYTMSILPFSFYFVLEILDKQTLKNVILLALTISLLILSHQLIAFPGIIFIVLFFLLHLLINTKEYKKKISYFFSSLMLAFGLSSFFWLPMLYEKQFTFLDKELGGYIYHFIDPYQFWFSPWGFGGSVNGIGDGMTFQLGKIHILLFILSFFLFIFHFIKKQFKNIYLQQYCIVVILFLFSIFMTTSYSSVIWSVIKPLWNMQFPWRFMGLVSIFMAITCSYIILFLKKILKTNKNTSLVLLIGTLLCIVITIIKYYPYCRPQRFITIPDKALTTFSEIAWKQSQTVLHFVPKGVKSKKNSYGVDILNIEKNNLPKNTFKLISGSAQISTIALKYNEKKYQIIAKTPIIFQQNTFNFPGWKAYLIQDNNANEIIRYDDNDYKLIQVKAPKGIYQLLFKFENTPIRLFANIITIFSIGLLIILFGIILLIQKDKKRIYY